MNVLDIIFAVPLLWALYRGFRKGLVYMVASLTALVLGVLGAMRFHGTTGSVLQEWFNINPDHLNMVSFAVTFILIVLVVHLAAFLVDKLIKAVALSFINRAAGMVFGLFTVAFVISIVLMPIDAANRKNGFISKETIEGSLLYTPLTKLAPAIFPYLNKEEFRNLIPRNRDEDQQPFSDMLQDGAEVRDSQADKHSSLA
ncbi:MAG: CvpA family protein [Bacteroidales bacterium]|nr:CvpA family protein [Bacteroidales bacterium]